MPEKSTHVRQELPKYLGFGTLDRKSVVTQSGKTTANYISGKEVVYQVTVGKNSARLIEFFNDEEFARSGHTNLERAFLHHMMSLPPHRHDRFQQLYHQLTDNRNVFVQFGSQPLHIFFPAGYIFNLCQPIVAANQTAWEAFRRRIKRSSRFLRFEGENKGVILRLHISGKITAEDVRVAKCAALLLNLVQAVDLLWQNGVVPVEREYPLVVTDNVDPSPANPSIFLGDLQRDILTFAVIVNENSELSMDQIVANFDKGSIQLLKKMEQFAQSTEQGEQKK